MGCAAIVWAGQESFNLSAPCFACQGPSCSLQGEYAEFGPTNGTLSSASVFIGVPGGGPYTMQYYLTNDGGPPNLWQAIISSADGSLDFIRDTLSDAPGDSDPTPRSYQFNLPDETTVVNLKLRARQVRHYHPRFALSVNVSTFCKTREGQGKESWFC